VKYLVIADDGRSWIVGRLLTSRDFFGRRQVMLADDIIAVSSEMIFRLILPYDDHSADLPGRKLTVYCHDRVVRYDLVRYFPEEGFWIAAKAV